MAVLPRVLVWGQDNRAMRQGSETVCAVSWWPAAAQAPGDTAYPLLWALVARAVRLCPVCPLMEPRGRVDIGPHLFQICKEAVCLGGPLDPPL